MNKFNYKWLLKDKYSVEGIEHNNFNVFGTFVCGGGSTMGYKLAGYNHIGGLEIDAKVADIYKINHNPKYFYLEDIRKFNRREDLPQELYNLDILDGSPPCATFSMAGSRENSWGKSKKFKEGQTKQSLDDLVFEYIKTISKLKPKIAILENVKGIIMGNAKWYTKEIVKRLNNIGYTTQVFCLNAASMGVPQQRERMFFICSKKELNYQKLKLHFDEKPILFRNIDNGKTAVENKMSITDKKYWEITSPGQALSSVHPKGYFLGFRKLAPEKVPSTIMAGGTTAHHKYLRKLNNNELKLIGSYPLDFNFKKMKPQYIIGMSVPPVMIAQISHQIYLQWLYNKN